MQDLPSFFKRRRDSTRVIYEILSAVERGGSKTRMIYQANLNYRLAVAYLEFLLSSGHLKQDSGKNEKVRYGLTGKGENLRRLLQQVEEELTSLFPS